MNTRLTSARLALALILSASGRAWAGEINYWPFWVGQTDAAGEVRAWQAVGPLVFARQDGAGPAYDGFRPFYLHKSDPAEGLTESMVLYPFYLRRESAGVRSWTVFNLVNHAEPVDGESGRRTRSFDVWPVYFSRDTGFADSSYRAVFPIHGTIKRRLGYDRLDWTLFPLYGRSEKGGVTSTSTPWPFIRHREGNGNSGFALWPLFGHAEKPGSYRHRYLLWPLLYRQESRLSEPTPTLREGFLPFYARERDADSVSETYLWPFFGYTHRQAPQPYREVRYLWPLLVQGRGETRHINRWAPFYTHSRIKGVEKTWFGWPLIRHQEWDDGALHRSRSQLLFFVFWSEQQRSLARPNAAVASRTHFWPLLTVWDNGAGRVQAQFPSPLDVFFPGNDRIRQLYNPLFALYRLDQRGPGDVKETFLWNAISRYRGPERRAFHVGPLFSSETDARGIRLALGAGLIGLKRAPGQGWRLFLFDFSRPRGQAALPTPP